MSDQEKTEILDAIRQCAGSLGHSPSRAQFVAQSGIPEYRVLTHFSSWREALEAAGQQANFTNVRLDDGYLLSSWGSVARTLGRIPTRNAYRRLGKHSPTLFERFGAWATLPDRFREFAKDQPEWIDVLQLLPATVESRPTGSQQGTETLSPTPVVAREHEIRSRHSRLRTRPTYGEPIDFRGIRHAPVNEQGVVFLFGMIARELGYLVESVQAAYPDCEAKRQIAPGKWQRVFLEFEYESRNFRDHGHPTHGCDVIVCWLHNWPDCPPELEVLELQTAIESLTRSGK